MNADFSTYQQWLDIRDAVEAYRNALAWVDHPDTQEREQERSRILATPEGWQRRQRELQALEADESAAYGAWVAAGRPTPPFPKTVQNAKEDQEFFTLEAVDLSKYDNAPNEDGDEVFLGKSALAKIRGKGLVLADEE